MSERFKLWRAPWHGSHHMVVDRGNSTEAKLTAPSITEATPADAVEAFGGEPVRWCEEHGSSTRNVAPGGLPMPRCDLVDLWIEKFPALAQAVCRFTTRYLLDAAEDTEGRSQA